MGSFLHALDEGNLPLHTLEFLCRYTKISKFLGIYLDKKFNASLIGSREQGTWGKALVVTHLLSVFAVNGICYFKVFKNQLEQ